MLKYPVIAQNVSGALHLTDVLHRVQMQMQYSSTTIILSNYNIP